MRTALAAALSLGGGALVVPGALRILAQWPCALGEAGACDFVATSDIWIVPFGLVLGAVALVGSVISGLVLGAARRDAHPMREELARLRRRARELDERRGGRPRRVPPPPSRVAPFVPWTTPALVPYVAPVVP